jgi:acyl-CoA synthetase (AMP-forming)/AMP-acid ligase II
VASVSPAAGVADPPRELDGARGIYGSLATVAAEEPELVFLRDERESITYGELDQRVHSVAARLVGLGIGPGDPVVLWIPNGPQWAAAFFACARIGAVTVMASTRLRALDVRHILDDSQAVALVFEPSFLGIDYDRMVETAVRVRDDGGLPKLTHLVSTQPSVVPGVHLLDDLPHAQLPPAASDVHAPAVACYTSGTTGPPKGCLHSHTALVRNGTVAAALTGLGREDRIVCPVPFSHVFGFHMGVLQATLARATLVNAEPYAPARLLDTVESARGTVLYAVPTMAREALAAQRERPRDLASLRVALVAGAPVPSELREELTGPDGLGCEVTVVYGCTEAPTLTQLRDGDPHEARMTSVGRATDGVELKICRPGSSEERPTGEVGEVLTRGYNCMLGYAGDPEATVAKWRDGWLVTGDLGRLDEDGFLYLVGRSSDMFIVGGFNAHPRDIEAQLERLEGVKEAAVIGVPDHRLGHVAMAWVTVSSMEIAEPDVLAWAHEQLASYKRPRYVRVVSSLPRTANGKLSRVKLEQLARRTLPQLDWDEREA